MNRRNYARLKLWVAVAAILVVVSSGVALAADAYSISWWTVDGGGGSSQGGQFSVIGTIGQADTGTSTGGPYSLNGGFWNAQGAESPPPQSSRYEIYLPFLTR